MSPPKKNPSNADILKEIKEIKTMQVAQGTDIEALKVWKISEDAYKAALAQVKSEERENIPKNGSLNKELLKALVIAVGAVVALAGLWTIR